MSQREQQPTTATPTPPKRLYVRAVTPGLRKLLWIVFVLVALLSANAAYLSAITGMQWVTGEVYEPLRHAAPQTR